MYPLYILGKTERLRNSALQYYSKKKKKKKHVLKFAQCAASCWAHLRKQRSFLNPDLARDFKLSLSQRTQIGKWSFQKGHRVLTQLVEGTREDKIYSPHQVSHTGANHHHIKSLLCHNLIKTHICVISIPTNIQVQV